MFSFERKSPQSLLILVHRSWWNLDHAFSLCRVQLVALDASWSMPSIILNSVAVNSETVALSASSCDWTLVTSRLPNSCSFLQVSDLIFKSFCASTVVIECFKSLQAGVRSHAPANTVLWISVGALAALLRQVRASSVARYSKFRKSHDGDADLTRQFYEYHYISNPFPPAL